MQVHDPLWVTFSEWCEVRVHVSYMWGYLVVAVAKCWKICSLGIFVENQLTRNVWFISELSIPTADLCKCFSFCLESSFPLALPININSLPFTSQCPSSFLKEVFSEPYMLSQIHLLYVFILSVQCLKFWFTTKRIYKMSSLTVCNDRGFSKLPKSKLQNVIG